MTIARRISALAVGALLVAFAPGLAPYEAVAQVIGRQGPTASAGAGVPVVPPPVAATPASLLNSAVLAGPIADQPSVLSAPSAPTTPAAAGAAGAESAAIETPANMAAAEQAPRAMPGLSAAVGRISQAGSNAWRFVLNSVFEGAAATNASRDAAEYEVHRADLRARAERGEVRSLRPITRAHADAILADLAARKPRAAVFDYDDTLARYREPVSPEIAAGLATLSPVGVSAAILTDRPDLKKTERDASIIDSLAPMTPPQKSGLLVGAVRGTRVLEFDDAGAAVLIHDETPRFTDAMRAAISAASAAAAEKFGRQEYDGKEEIFGNFNWCRFLPLGTPLETVLEAARFMQAELDRAGVPIVVEGRNAKDPKNPSYLAISLLDKSVGIKFLRGKFAPTGVEALAAESMLIVGDSFFGVHTVDSAMAKAAPGALTIAVGGFADPRLDNTFVWPTRGSDASLELLTALGRPAPAAPGPDDPINMKTLAGLVLQTIPSLAAYMLVTLAFVAVATATPGVGWTGYGILMSLSPMAGIAAAVIMGDALKNMSARNAMALNALLRVVSLMALPTFHFFGIVNFGTLLVGAMAEGFLLSSIMTAQGAFLRVLFPAKQLGNINNTLFILFPFVQMILGALFSVGRLADVLSPFAIFARAAAVNLALVPIIWKTIPNIKLARAAAASVAAPVSLARRAAAFARENAKPALALAAAVGLFSTLTFLMPPFAALGSSLGWSWPAALAAVVKSHPALSAPLPIIAALVYWISRTAAFRALVRGETREPSPAERELTARRETRLGAVSSGDREMESELASITKDLGIFRRRQVWAVGLISLTTIMFYPLYLVAAPNVAGILAGPHKIELASQFLGALFLGGMISVSARTKLPSVRVPVAIGVHRLIQAAVVGTAGLWMFTKVFPGAVLVALGAMAAAAGLIQLASRVTDRGWIKFAGVGFAVVWLPFVVWSWPALLPFLTVKTAMYLALLVAGIVNGPSVNALFAYLYRNTKVSESSRVSGVNGSFLNAGVSAGYSLLAIASGFLHPAYPAVLAALGIINLIIGGVFWRSPRFLPGLSEKFLEPRKPEARK